ncbi:hypothetical protein VTK73DRAFT_4449 [Phialemonium thermophilum]|uniref:Uncharacterized protein n=1 Tax=Phialemonium thermophilum TaxID=223376 RepID=A0ABR3V953_9PEZI
MTRLPTLPTPSSGNANLACPPDQRLWHAGSRGSHRCATATRTSVTSVSLSLRTRPAPPRAFRVGITQAHTHTHTHTHPFPLAARHGCPSWRRPPLGRARHYIHTASSDLHTTALALGSRRHLATRRPCGEKDRLLRAHSTSWLSPHGVSGRTGSAGSPGNHLCSTQKHRSRVVWVPCARELRNLDKVLLGA